MLKGGKYMRNLDHAEKVVLWTSITVLFAIICGFLWLNQLVPPAVDELVPTILPCWVLGLFMGLTVLSALNSFRHARKVEKTGVSKLQLIKKQSGQIFF